MWTQDTLLSTQRPMSICMRCIILLSSLQRNAKPECNIPEHLLHQQLKLNTHRTTRSGDVTCTHQATQSSPGRSAGEMGRLQLMRACQPLPQPCIHISDPRGSVTLGSSIIPHLFLYGVFHKSANGKNYRSQRAGSNSTHTKNELRRPASCCPSQYLKRTNFILLQ